MINEEAPPTAQVTLCVVLVQRAERPLFAAFATYHSYQVGWTIASLGYSNKRVTGRSF